jgi:hypothetical protein
MPIGPCKYLQAHMRVVLTVGPVGWLFTDGSLNKRQLANRQTEESLPYARPGYLCHYGAGYLTLTKGYI